MQQLWVWNGIKFTAKWRIGRNLEVWKTPSGLQGRFKVAGFHIIIYHQFISKHADFVTLEDYNSLGRYTCAFNKLPLEYTAGWNQRTKPVFFFQHGVHAPRVWKQSLQSIHHRSAYNSHITQICIRDAIKSTNSKGGFRVSRQGRLTRIPFPPHSPLPLTIRHEMLF